MPKIKDRKGFSLRDVTEMAVGIIRGVLGIDPQDHDQKQPEKTRELQWDILIDQVYGYLWSDDFIDQYGYLYLVDVYVENDGKIVLILNGGNKIYRAYLNITNNMVTLTNLERVEIVITPTGEEEQQTVMEEERQRGAKVIVRRDEETNQWRFWAVPAGTAILNKSGEIDTMDLFDRFVDNAKRYGYPELRLYHQDDDSFVIGQVDTVFREGALYVASGLFNDTDLADYVRQDIEADPEFWGASIGFLSFEYRQIEVADGINVVGHVDGFNHEISLLPESDASHFFTALETPVMEERMTSKKVKDVLRRVVKDDDLLEDLENRLDETNRQIKTGGYIVRKDQGSDDDPPQDDVETPPVDEGQDTDEQDPPQKTDTQADQPVEDSPDQMIEIDDLTLDTIIDAVTQNVSAKYQKTLDKIQETLNGLVSSEQLSASEIRTQNTIKTISDRLTDLEKSDDQKLSELKRDMPRRQKIAVTYRRRNQPQSEDEENQSMDDMANHTLANMRN